MVTRRRRYFSVHFRLLNLFPFFYSLQYMIIWTNVPCLHVHSRRCVSLLCEKFCTGHFVQTLFLRKCHSIFLFVFSDYNVFCVVHFISLFCFALLIFTIKLPHYPWLLNQLQNTLCSFPKYLIFRFCGYTRNTPDFILIRHTEFDRICQKSVRL